MTSYNVAVGYQTYGGPCYFHLHGEVKMEAARFYKILVSYHITLWYHNPEDQLRSSLL